MGNKSIPEVALERSVSWIEAVEKTLSATTSEENVREIMKAGGEKCARQILKECAEILGREPKSVKELIETTNKRRVEQLGLNNLWELNGNVAHLKINECGCTLVTAGLAKPNPVHCLCTVGMFENIFTAVCKGPVRVEVLKTIGDGDDACEFNVHFEE